MVMTYKTCGVSAPQVCKFIVTVQVFAKISIAATELVEVKAVFVFPSPLRL